MIIHKANETWGRAKVSALVMPFARKGRPLARVYRGDDQPSMARLPFTFQGDSALMETQRKDQSQLHSVVVTACMIGIASCPDTNHDVEGAGIKPGNPLGVN